MLTAKDLIIKVIPKKDADAIIKKFHYSGKSTQNSQVSFGIFANNRLIGAAQFGPSIDKRRTSQTLGVKMNEYLELNRLAISDEAPKNSESRVISYCMRVLKKQYPFLKCILSFADGCQCGDGTIYRASGFKLMGFKKNKSLLMKDGEVYFDHGTKRNKVVAKKAMDNKMTSNGKYLSHQMFKDGWKPLEGYQFKYVYYFDKELEKKIKFLKFEDIPDEIKMYKGKMRIEHEINASTFQVEEGGVIPTDALQNNPLLNAKDSANIAE